MSQYPSPYPGPNIYIPSTPYGGELASRFLAPARRASMLMFVVGGIGLVCGFCCGLVGLVAPMSEMIERSGVDFSQLSEIGTSPETVMRIVYIVMSAGSLIVSIGLLLLATFVRRGSMGAIITSIIVCVAIWLLLLINFVSGLWQAIQMQNTAAAAGVGMIVLLLALFGLQLLWLIQAARGASSLRMAQAQYQMQYWQYMQYQQMYGQAGAGYGYLQQAPPAPPTPAPPPADAGDSHGTSTQG